ncbi:MAG TPA: cell wall anchor protein, partial [Chloroflexia bacterium]|nr:cell wall anchor protein [Chloroflexia bacterium]
QNPSGAFRYQATPPDDNAGATYQVLPALAGVVLPVPPAPQLPAPAGNPPGMPTTGQGPTPDLPLAALLALLLVLGGRRLTTRPARD